MPNNGTITFRIPQSQVAIWNAEGKWTIDTTVHCLGRRLIRGLSYRPCVGLERRINRHALLPLGLTLRLAIFPVYPLNGIDRQVSSYSLPYGCEEGLLAEAAEHPEALQLVLDRILHFSKTQLDAGGV